MVSVILTLLVYGALSRPAPAGLGMAERVVGLGLVLAVGLRPALALVSGAAVGWVWAPLWTRVGAAVFIPLLWLPLIRGLALGWPLEDMVRDLVPLGYLFLPVLLARYWAAPDPGQTRTFTGALAVALAVAGALLAVRWWMEDGWGFGAVGVRPMSDGLSYYLNSPTVLFAALWLPFRALSPDSGSPFNQWRWLWAGPALGLGGLGLLALAGAVHRLAIVAALLSGTLFLVRTLVPGSQDRARALPWAALLVAGVALSLLLPGAPLARVLEQVWIKSEMVGINERAAEALAVLEQVSRSPTAFLLGDGWGAKVGSPAVGGLRVGYTHSVVSYIILKAGLVGALLLFAWLLTLVPPLVRTARADPVLALAAFPPLMIGLFFHTSFKYLCFGVLLVLALHAGSVPPAATGQEARP